MKRLLGWSMIVGMGLGGLTLRAVAQENQDTNQGLHGAQAKSADDFAKKDVQRGERITMDQVPDPVRRTLEQQAKGNKIIEVGKATKNGKIEYQGEFMENGKDVEVMVSPDGKLLGRHIESKSEERSEHHEGVK